MKNLKKIAVDLLPDELVLFFSRPYLAGHSLDDAVQLANHLERTKNLLATVDLLGEEVKAAADAEQATQTYVALAKKLRGTRASMSLKLTALGLDLSMALLEKNLELILAEAQAAGVAVTIDMEDSRYTDVTLDCYKKYLQTYTTLGTVLQTRLHRTGRDVSALVATGRALCRVRLCIGIYLEASSIASTDKKEMKERLIAQAQEMVMAGHIAEVATHDEWVIETLLAWLKTQPAEIKSRVEFQMLYGVPRSALIAKLQAQGYPVRLYLPFSNHKKEAINYLKRRLFENPHLAYFTVKNILGL